MHLTALGKRLFDMGRKPCSGPHRKGGPLEGPQALSLPWASLAEFLPFSALGVAWNRGTGFRAQNRAPVKARLKAAQHKNLSSFLIFTFAIHPRAEKGC
jgi:glycine cleavage system protein P-like pyridoxal-binding family